MSDAFLGEIRMMSWNYPPRNWAFCNGNTLSIQQNSALFALLGTTYGGNGVSTFQLPDMRARVGIGMGQTANPLGSVVGAPSVTLLTSNVPIHTHQFMGTTTVGDTATLIANSTVGSFPVSTDPSNAKNCYTDYAAATQTTFPAADIGASGGNQPHENRQPYLCINFGIALSGIFPSRN